MAEEKNNLYSLEGELLIVGSDTSQSFYTAIKLDDNRIINVIYKTDEKNYNKSTLQVFYEIFNSNIGSRFGFFVDKPITDSESEYRAKGLVRLLEKKS